MSGCALRRWGSGTPCSKEPNSESGKEMKLSLAAMQAERDRQDMMWMRVPEEEAQPTKTKPTTTVKKDNSK